MRISNFLTTSRNVRIAADQAKYALNKNNFLSLLFINNPEKSETGELRSSEWSTTLVWLVG